MFARFTPRQSPLYAWLAAGVLLLVFAPATRAQSDNVASSPGGWDIGELLDRLPNMSPFGKLGENPYFPVRYYARPRLGDLFHRDYMRVPVGAKVKVTEPLALHAEVESYFTHGLKGAAGYGLSRGRVGAKYEQEMTVLHPIGWSTGIDFDSPLSRPPMELTDGHRHLLPYVAVSTTLIPDCNLVGYAGTGADFLSHTALPANFGRNQLHANTLLFSTGLTRDWKRFRVALTATWNTTSLLSDENKNVFALRPDVIIPLTRKPGPSARTHLLLIIGGRVVDGPDGTELGVTGSVRIEFAVQAGRERK